MPPPKSHGIEERMAKASKSTTISITCVTGNDLPSATLFAMSVEYHVYCTISIWGLASDLDEYKGP
jgi:hypothetical protein